MKPILWLHFIPVVLSCFYMLPWLMTSGEEKVAFYLKYIFDLELAVAPWFLLSQTTIACIYLVFSFRLIQQYKKHLSNEASSIDYTYHRWLLFFALSTLLPIIAMISWVITGGNSTTIVLILTMIFSFIFSVYVAVLIKPEVFHSFPKESDLSLSTLASQTNIPSHYLSQVINEKMKCSFLDFVNGYRVNEAKRMLKDDKYENHTIIALAYEAGFNSKSAFYSAFKKHTGLTPSAFKKQVAFA